MFYLLRNQMHVSFTYGVVFHKDKTCFQYIKRNVVKYNNIIKNVKVTAIQDIIFIFIMFCI
jgi:hypothetical protein